MNTTSNCCGGTTTTSTCEGTIAELPRYYPRQLITPDDLTLEQDYFRDRHRRHNRLLHGWGVVCGALVCPVTSKDANGIVTLNTWQVQVQPGYVLGPYGDEIILDCVRTIDLRTNGVSGTTGDPCIDVPDPWCSQVTVPRDNGTFYIAVKYKQSMTRPVRVQPNGCGCSDNSCENSRLHDGYEIGILNCCPDTHQSPPSLDNLFKGDIPSCPDCPPQPWVVLAAVTVDADGDITSVDNCSCRRLVASFSSVWWQCGTLKDVKVANAPVQVNPDKPIKVTVKGSNITKDATFTFGNGVTVVSAAATPGATTPSVDLLVSASTNATAGSRSLTIVDAECSVAVVPNAINVVQPASNAPVLAPKPKEATAAATNKAKNNKKIAITPDEE